MDGLGPHPLWIGQVSGGRYSVPHFKQDLWLDICDTALGTDHQVLSTTTEAFALAVIDGASWAESIVLAVSRPPQQDIHLASHGEEVGRTRGLAHRAGCFLLVNA